MPVNENLLDAKIKALTDEGIKIADRVERLRKCRYNLQEIKRDIIRGDDGDELSPVLPIDRRTQKPFTVAARQKQYDDNITIANKILNE